MVKSPLLNKQDTGERISAGFSAVVKTAITTTTTTGFHSFFSVSLILYLAF